MMHVGTRCSDVVVSMSLGMSTMQQWGMILPMHVTTLSASIHMHACVSVSVYEYIHVVCIATLCVHVMVCIRLMNHTPFV